MADPVFPGKVENRVGNVLPLICENHRSQFLRQGQRTGQQTLRMAVDNRGFFGRGLHINSIPISVELPGQS